VAVELAGLAIANVGYLLVGTAAFAAAGWVTVSEPASWSRLGAAYLFGLVLVVLPASYLALLSVPVGASAAAIGVAVVVLAVWRRGIPRRLPSVRLGKPGPVALCTAMIVLVGVVLLAYVSRTFVTRPLVDNDAWAVWTARARLLYQDPGQAPAMLRTGQFGPTPYPIALPTLAALGFGAMGRYDGTLIGLQSFFLLLGFGTALWAIFYRRAHPIVVALTIVAIVSAPELLYQLVTQYADVPLGLFVGLGVAATATWVGTRDEDFWLPACAIVFMAMAGLTKSEGFMFVVAAAAALLLVQLGPGWKARLPKALVVVAAIALLLVPWRIYCAAYGLSTPDYDLGNVVDVHYLARHSDRVHPAVKELFRQMWIAPHWGYLALAIVVGILTGLAARRIRVTLFTAAWITLSFAGLLLVYWVSTLPTSENLTNSSFRTIVSLVIAGASTLPVLLPTPRR
jgi:hypothetical protein